jgi:Winged helix-turn helix
MPREAPRLVLDPYELLDLRRLERAPSTPQALAFRARLILRCARAPSPRNDEVAADLGCDSDTVSKWRRRFRARRLDGLADLPRSGRPAAFSPGRQTQGPGAGHHAAGRRRRAHLPLVAG